MEYNDQFINDLFEKEIIFSNRLSNKYNYPDNITHLLYLIIPAFILKYGIKYQTMIENCFSCVPIIIDDKQDKIYQAYYFSSPRKREEEIETTKGIVLKNYRNISLMQLIDNLVHEYNHAINSLNNEITVQDNEILIRTGLVYNFFNKEDLSFIKVGDELILEEVLNTRQSELIIDIIKNFSNYNLNNTTLINTLYSIDKNYKSNSYFLESLVCNRLVQNKSFISTMENLRFNGNIYDIHYFFDGVVGKDGSLLELCKCLNKSLELQKKLATIKIFKNSTMNKIKAVNTKASFIVSKFDQNTIYK